MIYGGGNHKGNCEVYSATELCTNKKIIVKRLKKIDENARRELQSEINILKKLNDPGVISFFAQFNKKDILHMVLPYIEGPTLYNHVIKHGPMKLELIGIVTVQIRKFKKKEMKNNYEKKKKMYKKKHVCIFLYFYS